jgi:D-alanyl-lipoteichoic acid acyltransferase DltB (MBOAT superfamily)
MAIGVGKLLGYRVTRNFNHPFIARNMAEFWRRWHISLTQWITDYVFMPLNIAFRTIGTWGIVMAAMINLLLIGLWHGANWTFACFGLYHGLLFIPLILSGAFGKNKKLKANNHGLPFLKDFGKMLTTYVLVAVGLILFRAEDISQAFNFIYHLASNGLSGESIIDNYGKLYILFGLFLLVLEWIQRKEEHALQLQDYRIFRKQPVRFVTYLIIILLIITFTGRSQAFIYFQF